MLLATKPSVYRLDTSAREATPEALFEADGVRRVAAGHELALVALDDGGLVTVRDGAERLVPTGIDGSVESLLLLGEDPLAALVGTEPPHVYRLTGDAISRIPAFDALKCRDGWHTPWGGPPAVRSLAATPDGWVYADIHVGSIMRSADRGETWEPVTPDLHEDVHQVNTCPAAPGRVYAATARAVYLSDDRGRSWYHRADDLNDRYGRAIAPHPEQPDVVLITVSDGPHGDNVHGQLYLTRDAGRSWHHVADGFPDSTPANINTFHVTFTPDGRAWAIVGDTLYVGEEDVTRWRAFWTAPQPLEMLATTA